MDAAEALRVEVVYCPGPGKVDRVELLLAPGSTLADALRASGLVERHGLDAGTLRAGIWCKPREASTLLRERDRIEIYRALTVDPKEARRQRFKRHKTG